MFLYVCHVVMIVFKAVCDDVMLTCLLKEFEARIRSALDSCIRIS